MTYPAPVQMARASLVIDGLDCSGQGADGVQLVFNSVSGWFGGAGVRSSFTPRPADHGSFAGPVFRDNLTPTFSGWAYADTRDQVAAKLMRLCAALADGHVGTVTVDDPSIGALSIQAQLAAAPQIAWDANQNTWMWQLQVVATDPLKYGPQQSVSTGLPSPGSGGLVWPLFDGTGKLEWGTPGDPGRVTLTNPGTADTWPQFQVAGTVLGGVVLTDVDSGRQIVWRGDVPAGANLLIIDSSSGHAYINGSLQDTQLTVKQWFPVPAGGSSTVQFSTLGSAGQSGSLTALFAPAYW